MPNKQSTLLSLMPPTVLNVEILLLNVTHDLGVPVARQ